MKGRVKVNISGSQTYYEFCQINGTPVLSKTLVFRQHKNVQDGFFSLKDGFRPGQPETVVTNANIAAVAGHIKQDARLTVKNIPHSVGISYGSAHNILTPQGFCSMCPNCLTKADGTWVYKF